MPPFEVESSYPTLVSGIDLNAGIQQTAPAICLRPKVNGWLNACVKACKERGEFAPTVETWKKLKELMNISHFRNNYEKTRT